VGSGIISSLMMRTKMVHETSVSFIHLTQLIAREDFILWKQGMCFTLGQKDINSVT
jgi:hypothetical protein